MILTKIIVPIFINKNNIYLLQSNTNQSLYVQIILYLIQNNTKQKILRFQSTWLILS